ncbi:MAG: hypothetical protein KY475_10025, partial [Planctomycetes bacterium]|nr:hypothetical protein [Planctomycetota bacterium]
MKSVMPPEEVIRKIGVEGLFRIERRAVHRLWASKLKEVFRPAFKDVQREWNEHKNRLRTQGISEQQDALAAFGKKLGVDRSTAGRYKGGLPPKEDESINYFDPPVVRR